MFYRREFRVTSADKSLLRTTVGKTNAETDHAVTLEHQIAEHLQRYFAAHQGVFPPHGLYDRLMALVEKPLIEETLRATAGNQLKAARVLGINRNTLRKKMQALGIVSERERSNDDI